MTAAQSMPSPRAVRLADAGGRGRAVKHLQDRRACGAAVNRRQRTDIIRCNAPLPVSRTRQRDSCPAAGCTVDHLDRVADGVYVGVGGPHMRVNGNGAASAQLQSGRLRQCILGVTPMARTAISACGSAPPSV